MQETERSAKREATREMRIRIMGTESEGFRNKKEFPAMTDRRRGKSLGWSHVRWVAGSGSAWAAGGGDEGGSSSDEGKFHDFNEVVFDGAMA